MKIQNKKARFNYHVLDTFEAGVVLTGAEVKSLRAGRADLSDSFARIQNGELVLKNAYIYPYQSEAVQGYDPRHDRKLLMHRREIDNLLGKISGSAVTLIPLSIYTTRNMFKVEIALAASKKKFDKRKAIKARDQQRRIEQEME
ncbi:MAG: SsrA-binding protein SmpB [Candidatus Paceibacterales bacterium]